MNIADFIKNYKDAFGPKAELPIAFWYSDSPLQESEVIKGCLFKCFYKVRKGTTLSLSATTITCGGGLFYTGFTEMPERVPRFVSFGEKYKQTPELVLQFIEHIKVMRTERKYLNLARVDRLSDLSVAEGFLFFATPDTLSGLTTWAWFDKNDDNTVTTLFGSGCSQAITLTVNENRENGKRIFLGGFDPSVRPFLRSNELTLSIPASRFKEMLGTMKESCLYGTKAWGKMQKRIQSKASAPGA